MTEVERRRIEQELLADGKPAMNAFIRTFKVGPHTVTFTIPFTGARAGAIRCEWEPLPRRLSKKRIAEYMAKRDACLRAFATWAGISIFVATPDSGDYKTIDPDPQS